MEKLFPVRTALKALDSEPVGPKRKPHSEIISALPLIFAVKVISEVVAEEAHFADTKKQDDFTPQDTTAGFTTIEEDSNLPF